MASWLERTVTARLRAKHREHLGLLDRARLDLEAALLTADQARQNRCRVRVAQVVDGLKAIERNMRRMSAKAETA